MNKVLVQIQESLESIKRNSNDQDQMEFWSARNLMGVLGYLKWQKFTDIIEKAKESCRVSNQFINSHFLPAPVKSFGGRPREESEPVTKCHGFRRNPTVDNLSTVENGVA